LATAGGDLIAFGNTTLELAAVKALSFGVLLLPAWSRES